MVLEFHQKFFSKFKGYFFIELEFMELKYNGKLEFPKLKYPKSRRFLHNSETVVD